MDIVIKKKDSLIVFIGIIVISYATFQTAKGFQLQTGGFLQSWVFALIIGSFLIFLSIMLKKNLADNKFLNVFVILLFYLAVAFFSFCANFNTFYSSTIQDTEIKKCLEDISQKTTTLSVQVKKSIEVVPNKINQIRVSMQSQILDLENPGWGKKTSLLANDISNLLGTRLSQPSGTPQQIVKKLNDQIKLLLATRDSNLSSFIGNYTEKIKYLDAEIKRAKDASSFTFQKSKIIELQAVYNNICAESIATIGDTVNIKCKSLNYHSDDLGKITYSLNHGFENLNWAILPLLQSALLDFALPIIILLSSFFSGERDNNERRQPLFPNRNNS